MFVDVEAGGAITESASAFASASESTSDSRDVLTSTACDFIASSSAVEIMCSVSGAAGACRLATSDSASSFSRLTREAPSSVSASGLGVGAT